MSKLLSGLVSSSVVPRSSEGSLLLAANPGNPQDFLYRGVVLLFHRSVHSILGLQLNRVLRDVSLENIVEGLGFDFDQMRSSPYSEVVYFGGSINTNRLHFVHSLDWSGMNTHVVTDSIGVTSDISILSALSVGEGPSQYRACAGNWRWDLDTLRQQIFNFNEEAEEQDHYWEIAPIIEKSIFGHDGESQWLQVLDSSMQSQVQHWMN